MSAIAYGSGCLGNFVGAVSNSVFGITLPFANSLSTKNQIAEGNMYRNNALDLMDKYFDMFDRDTKMEIKLRTRRMMVAKERVDRKSWFSAKDASTYREEAQELLAIVEDNSSNLRAKETFLRNNLSSSTLNSVVIVSFNEGDDLPLHNISSNAEYIHDPDASPDAPENQRSPPGPSDVQASQPQVTVADGSAPTSAYPTSSTAGIAVNTSEESLGLRHLYHSGPLDAQEAR